MAKLGFSENTSIFHPLKRERSYMFHTVDGSEIQPSPPDMYETL